jgi:hypothetical protein
MTAHRTLARIDAALLDHATSEAQAWVWERIEREVAA